MWQGQNLAKLLNTLVSSMILDCSLYPITSKSPPYPGKTVPTGACGLISDKLQWESIWKGLKDSTENENKRRGRKGDNRVEQIYRDLLEYEF